MDKRNREIAELIGEPWAWEWRYNPDPTKQGLALLPLEFTTNPNAAWMLEDWAAERYDIKVSMMTINDDTAMLYSVELIDSLHNTHEGQSVNRKSALVKAVIAAEGKEKQ